ncbi:4'-phosphopantetheinyl transferase family protein [Brevibacillus agri]|uniref:4'-phosphopantetheinyl transferase family protein n=1 Tax=Brevibacillus agri TaxID=51101 RepID=UPI003D19E268
MQNIFSEEEYRDLLELNENDRLFYFYDLWTIKESYVKAIGKGLAIPLDSFTVKKFSDDDIKIIGHNNN